MSENLRDGTLLGNTSGNGRYDSDDNGGDDLSDLWLPSTSNGNGHANGRPISTWTRDVLEVPSNGKDPIWGSPPLPDKFSTLYPWQVDALERVMEAFNSGSRIVMLEAPTGAGKTILAECTRRLNLGNGIHLSETFDLQQQMADSFPDASQLRGRSNYKTLNYPQLFRDKWNPLSCAECTKQKVGEDDDEGGEWRCDFCDPHVNSCPYEVAKRSALAADLAILNYSYFLTEANGPGRFAKRDLVVADEADNLKKVILGFASVTISPKMISELGIEPPSHKTKSDKTDTEVWPQWVRNEAIPRVLAALKRYPPSNDVKTIRKRNQLLRLLKQLHTLAEDLPLGNWVYDGWKFGGAIEFKPIRADKLAVDLLFRHARRWLLMSATILEPREMVESLGIPEEWCPLPESFVVMPWIFPPSNRPIYYPPKLAVDMTNKNKDESWPKMATSVSTIIDKHPDVRILIHTVSYALAKYLMETIDNPRMMTYTKSSERQEVLDRYKATPGAVLVASSFDRGISLDDDLGRVIIVCKIPWGNIGDKQVAAALYTKGGRLSYATDTVRTLVQMTGRCNRHFADHAKIYILDRQFATRVWKDYKHLLPQGWKDALDSEESGIVWR